MKNKIKAIVVNKSLKPSSPAAKEFFYKILEKYEGKEVSLTIAKWSNNRSLAQNAYYWGVILRMLEETGNTSEEMHEYMKDKFLDKKFVKLKNKVGVEKEVEVLGSTTSLTVAEWERFCEKIRIWSSLHLGIVIPLPNETDFYEYN